jgi:ABC-type transporter Mla subunit MlaD
LRVCLPPEEVRASWPAAGSGAAILGVGERWVTGSGGRLLGAAAALALVLAAAACGGGGKSDTTTTTATAAAGGGSSAVQWAGGVCSALTTWKTSIQGIHLSAHPKGSALEEAGNQVEDATQTLAQSLKKLGKPETAQGQAAKEGVDSLATVLSNDVEKIKETLKPTPPTAAAALQQISAVTATLAAMAHNLTLAVGHLKQFDPSGELEKAFHQAPACSPYIS